MREQVLQTIDQIFQGETGSASASREFRCHLAELAFALGRFLFKFLIADECSRALMGFEHAAEFELAIGAHDSIGVDGEIDGELPDGRELVAGGERSGSDAGAHLIDELAVDGNAGVEIEGELEWAGAVLVYPGHRVLMYYTTSTLCQAFLRNFASIVKSEL
jgi:hypothetical protein